MSVHRTLRKIRANKGLSQEYLAYHLNVSQNCYHKIEAGKVSLKVETLMAISKILQVPVADFFVEYDEASCSKDLSKEELKIIKGGGYLFWRYMKGLFSR